MKKFITEAQARADGFEESWSAVALDGHIKQLFAPVFRYITTHFAEEISEQTYLWRLLCKSGRNLILYQRDPLEVNGRDIREVRGKGRKWNDYVVYIG